jgi:iron complex outermembrane recepter protein
MKNNQKTEQLRNLLKVSLLVSSAMLAQPAFAQSEQPAAPAANEDIVLDEIVVTATRRNSKLSDVPLSISALAEDTLVTRGVRDSSDIAYVAPGLSVVSDNTGTENITVRGVVGLGGTAATAFYLDETPISQLAGGYFTPRYFDIERVEVLRGPQGTLFGASSLGGAIRVITKRPNLVRVEGTVRAEGSTTNLGGENYVLDGAVNVPIISDVLALRVTGFYEKQRGWVKSFTPILSDDPAEYIDLGADGLRNNGIFDPASPDFDPLNRNDDLFGPAYGGFTGEGKRVGDQTVYGGRAALLLQASDALKLTASFHWQQRKNDGFSNSDSSIGLGLSQSGPDFRQARSSAEFRNLRSQLANLTGEFDAGFAKLTSSTSYEWNKESRLNDGTGLVLGGFVGAFGAVPRDANGQAGAAIISNQKKNAFTQELRLVSAGDGPLNWIVGGYYNRSNFDQGQDARIRGLTNIFIGSPLEGQVLNDSFITTAILDDLKELSFFGEIGYKLNDKLTATFGIRRFSIDRATGLGAYGFGVGGIPVSIPVQLPTKESGFTYKGVLNYKPSDNLLLFAGYTTGYRPGGVNGPPIGPDVDNKNYPLKYKTDNLAQYELGWKSSWLNRALTVNGALFYIDWTDIPTTVVSPNSGLDFVINGPKARNYGAELELVMRPTKGFDVNFGITVVNAKFSEDYTDPTGFGLEIKKGTRLPNVPNITLNAGLNYEWLVSDDTTARIGANIAHVAKRSQTANGTVSDLPGLVNAGLSAGIEVGKFDISVFVRNLFDSRALVGNTTVGGEVAGGVLGALNNLSYLQPRTVGASVQVKF